MTKKLEAMKQLLTAWADMSVIHRPSALFEHIVVLREAIKREEAQSVEPVGYADQHGRLYDIKVIKALMVNVTDMIPVYTHPAPAIKEVVINADYRKMWEEQVQLNQRLCTQLSAPTKQPLSEEREALIKELRNHDVSIARAAADMLAADTQKLADLELRIRLADACAARCQETALLALRKLDEIKAQQVAVPQGWKLVPMKPTYEMLAAFKDCNIPSGSYAFEDYNDQLDWEHGYDYEAILAAAPQSPQAASRVPMTIRQIAEATAAFENVWSDKVIGIARAIEAHHEIVEVKP